MVDALIPLAASIGFLVMFLIRRPVARVLRVIGELFHANPPEEDVGAFFLGVIAGIGCLGSLGLVIIILARSM